MDGKQKTGEFVKSSGERRGLSVIFVNRISGAGDKRHILYDCLYPLATAFITPALGMKHSQITWSIMTVWTIAAMITGGMLLFIGLFILEAGFCFFSIEDTSLMNVLTYGAKAHVSIP